MLRVGRERERERERERSARGRFPQTSRYGNGTGTFNQSSSGHYGPGGAKAAGGGGSVHYGSMAAPRAGGRDRCVAFVLAVVLKLCRASVCVLCSLGVCWLF